jgi:hypothetical protein
MIFATAANVMRIYLGLPNVTKLVNMSMGMSFAIIAIDMTGSFLIFWWQQWKER